MANQGYSGPLPPYYIQSSSPQTPNLGLTISGVDPIVAYNFVLIDAATGGGSSSVFINSVSVSNPNFNDTTPAAPGGKVNVKWQVSGSNVSAYVDLSGTGTVTSVGFATGSGAADALYTISGSPITTAGTITETLNTQIANRIFAGPTSGGAAVPTFRALVTADLPAGTGTVTSFSSGNLSPLFTTSVATPTTTPALSFSLSTQTANTVFAGPASGGAAGPTFRALVAADIPPGFGPASPTTSVQFNNGGVFGGSSNFTWNDTSKSLAITFPASFYGPDGSVTIDTATDIIELHTNVASGMTLFCHGTTAARAPVINSFRSRGSQGSPTSPLAGDILLYIGSGGFAGVSGYLANAQIQASATENWSSTATGTAWSITVVSNGNSTGAIAANFKQDRSVNLPGGPLTFGGSADAGISRLGAASLAFGNGTASDTTANLSFNKTISYAGIATVSQGQPAEYATVDLTAQSAAISATTLYAVPAGGQGMYRISWSATVTTAATTDSVLGGTNGFQIIYTSPTDSVVKTTIPGNTIVADDNTTGTAIGGTLVVYAKLSTNIQYSMGYASTGGTAMAYELHLKLESL